MNTVEVLERSDLSLPDMGTDQFVRLANLCTRVEYEPGTIIAEQGGEAHKVHVIEEGLVSIIVELGGGREQQIQTASHFEVFGWSAMVPPYRYTAKVRAIQRTKALVFDAEELRKLCLANPELCYTAYVGIARVLAQRLHNAFLQLIGITSQNEGVFTRPAVTLGTPWPSIASQDRKAASLGLAQQVDEPTI